MLLHNRESVDGSNPTAAAIAQKYEKPNMLKPFFIVFNCFIYLTYLITCFVFLDCTAEDEQRLIKYYRIVAGINGITFIVLTLALLNYGSRLEKIISSIKMKGLWAEAATSVMNNNNKYDNNNSNGS